MKIRIAGITQDSIVDGKGLRFVVFTQGCPHHCPGCHNPETHPLWGGELIEVREVIEQMNENPLSDGLTLSGGEPFFQPYACAEIAKAAKDRGLSVWCYTGYRLDELNTIHGADELLKYVDVLNIFLLTKTKNQFHRNNYSSFHHSLHFYIIFCQ